MMIMLEVSFALGILCRISLIALLLPKAYNDEQRLLRKRADLLPGDEWYNQQAYRALAQALGRCISHAADYGTVVLMNCR